MDSDLDRYFLESSATDAFRRISQMSVDLGGGRTIPLAEILEEEARERCKRLLRGHLEALTRQSEISDHIRIEALRLKGCDKPVSLMI